MSSPIKLSLLLMENESREVENQDPDATLVI